MDWCVLSKPREWKHGVVWSPEKLDSSFCSNMRMVFGIRNSAYFHIYIAILCVRETGVILRTPNNKIKRENIYIFMVYDTNTDFTYCSPFEYNLPLWCIIKNCLSLLFPRSCFHTFITGRELRHCMPARIRMCVSTQRSGRLELWNLLFCCTKSTSRCLYFVSLFYGFYLIGSFPMPCRGTTVQKYCSHNENGRALTHFIISLLQHTLWNVARRY